MPRTPRWCAPIRDPAGKRGPIESGSSLLIVKRAREKVTRLRSRRFASTASLSGPRLCQSVAALNPQAIIMGEPYASAWDLVEDVVLERTAPARSRLQPCGICVCCPRASARTRRCVARPRSFSLTSSRDSITPRTTSCRSASPLRPTDRGYAWFQDHSIVAGRAPGNRRHAANSPGPRPEPPSSRRCKRTSSGVVAERLRQLFSRYHDSRSNGSSAKAPRGPSSTKMLWHDREASGHAAHGDHDSSRRARCLHHREPRHRNRAKAVS